MAGLAVAMLAAFLVPGQVAPRAELNTAKEAYWAPFEPARIPQLVAEGKTVFVDVTAEWCITCQVNKATVLNRGEVNEFLKGDEVIAMQGDWTRPDETISKYLAGFNRFGIPFNAVYGPGAETASCCPNCSPPASCSAVSRRPPAACWRRTNRPNNSTRKPH